MFGYLLHLESVSWIYTVQGSVSVGTILSRIRKEEGGAQCTQGKKGHLYMGQLRRGKFMGLRHGELSLS